MYMLPTSGAPCPLYWGTGGTGGLVFKGIVFSGQSRPAAPAAPATPKTQGLFSRYRGGCVRARSIYSLIPSPFNRIPSPVKVYTLLTTTNRFGLPSFVNLCKTLGATGVTVFAFPQSFSPDSSLLSKINVQIGDLQMLDLC
jgi:hypothetical protein